MFTFSFKATNLKFSKGNSHLCGLIKIFLQILLRTSVGYHGGDECQIYPINYSPKVVDYLKVIR